MNLMKYKLLYFLFSTLLILPGLYYLVTSGLKLGIDFTGGALLEYKVEQTVGGEQLREVISKQGIEVGLITKLTEEFGQVEVRRTENVGPVIGKELEQKAILATAVASLAIVLYIAFSFRKVPKPTSSWRFGAAAIVALIHDVLMVVGA